MIWKTKLLDAEMDIEGQPVISVDRRGHFSVFGFAGEQNDEWVKCTEAKHADFVARFRKKITTPKQASNAALSQAATTRKDEHAK